MDCLPHDLLIARLHAFDCDLPSLNLGTCIYATGTNVLKINVFYSSWAEILLGVPQGSIIGPILFNILFCNLFLFIKNKDVVSYTDDTTPYKTEGNSAYVIHKLEVLGNTLLKWLNRNIMKASSGKYHLLSVSDSSKITIGNKTFSCCKCESF